MNIILQFNFEIEERSCRYYQIYVVVETGAYGTNFCKDSLEDSISSYFESSQLNEDLEHEGYVEEIMNESGFDWRFATRHFPESVAIHSFWI